MAEKFGSTGSVNNNLKIYYKRILDFFFFEPTDECEIMDNINKLSTAKSPGIESIPIQLKKA